MKKVLRDHGQVLHAAGHLSMYPVQLAADGALAFAHHGDTDGKKAIGWPVFFPKFDAQKLVAVVDVDAGELTLLKESDAIAQLGDLAKPPTFVEQVKHALGTHTPASGTDAAPPNGA